MLTNIIDYFLPVRGEPGTLLQITVNCRLDLVGRVDKLPRGLMPSTLLVRRIASAHSHGHD